MANNDKSNLKTIASIIKRQKTGAVFSIIVDNALYGLDKPKIAFTIIQPEKEPARFFADIPEVMKLLNCAYRRRNGATEIFRSYKGGHDKKRNCIVARVLNVGVKPDNTGREWFSFAVENCEGVQSYAENKYGQKVPGSRAVRSLAATSSRSPMTSSCTSLTVSRWSFRHGAVPSTMTS